MVLKIKTRICIFILLIASLGLCFYFYSSEEKRRPENELYFNMYQGMKKSCRGIIKNEEFKRSEGERYREGDTTMNFDGENYVIEITFVNNVLINKIFIEIYKVSNLQKQANEGAKSSKYYLGYIVEEDKLVTENAEKQIIPRQLQQAFEKEMIERLKSC